jgi:hypothetical protein
MMIFCEKCKHAPIQSEPTYRNELELTCGKSHPVRPLRLNGRSIPQATHKGLVRSDGDQCPDFEAVPEE